MSPDPATLQILAVIGVVMGFGQLFYGVSLLRSQEGPKQFLGCVMQGGGMGWLAAAAIFYIARQYEWAFIAAFAALLAGSGVGSLVGMQRLKASGDNQQ